MKSLKDTIEIRKKQFIDISSYLKNDYKREKNLKEFKVEHRSKLYIIAKRIGKYLQKKGFHKLVSFVHKNLNLDQYQYSYTMTDFLIPDNQEFISNAFRIILQTEPTKEENEYYLTLLKSGMKSKMQIVTILRFSPEGKIKKLKISGIKKRYIIFTIYEMPVIGQLVKVLYRVWTMPKLIQKINCLENDLFNATQDLKKSQKDLEKDVKERLSIPDIPNYKEIESIDFFTQSKKGFAYDENISALNYDEQYYSLFENAFYNHDAVLKKQEIYLDYLPKINSSISQHLDIGCGRGEFLTLLRKNDFHSLGVDINSLEIKKLKEQNFDVEHIDMIKFLEKTTKTFSSISALQVIEHIDYDTLKEFVNLSYQKLELSGAIILETINPHNKVAFNSFYMDETHKRPLPPEMVAFLLQYVGFKDVKFIYSSPMPPEFRSINDERINYHDYAVIGYKI